MATDVLDVGKMLDEINSIPSKPSLKGIQGDSYKKLGAKQYEVIQKITKAHIDSFNFMVDEGLPKGIKFLKPLEMLLPDGNRLKIAVTDAVISHPRVPKDSNPKTKEVYPSECRMRGSTYSGKLQVTFRFWLNGVMQDVLDISVGEIPIMLKTKLCNLAGLSPAKLVERLEDAEEIGGYFVVNGKERVIRMLTAQRRNYPLAIIRKGWADSGKLFTEYGILYRFVRGDQLGSNMILHYLSNGTARLRIFYRKMPIFLPIVMVLKSLCDVTDQYIYQEMTRGKEEDSFFCGCAVNMIRLVAQEGYKSQQEIKSFIGGCFRVMYDGPPWLKDEEVTDELLKGCVSSNLKSNKDKFNLLILMVRKLFALAKGECAAESPDNPMFHEIHLSGHIYFTLLLERFEAFLSHVKTVITRKFEDAAKSGKTITVNSPFIHTCLSTKFGEIVRPMNTLIATGNLTSKTGLGLMQSVGLAVMAEKINFWRFVSHFRAVHRGAFFQEMRTTACRKLYPEAWGFLCPVHTPDGTPCGLLNHLAEMCVITNHSYSTRDLEEKTLPSLGMEPLTGPRLADYSKVYDVLLDGKLVGHVKDEDMEEITEQLRILKASDDKSVPKSLEIGWIPKTGAATQYPALYLFSTPSRMVRPVYNLKAQAVELIGTFEQPYMEICVVGEEAHSKTTHQELKETSMLSLLALQIPFPDFNQSPRNMYACQMGKQTMGTPSHTMKFRSDVTKMYTVNNPQSPIVRPIMHDHYRMDEYPYGTNAVVAVISYTGYDMEDALILNKASVERGFKHGAIYKTHVVDLKEIGGGSRFGDPGYAFGRAKDANEDIIGNLDVDGLPFVGTRFEYGDKMCSYIDLALNTTHYETYKSTEVAFVSDVKILGSENGKASMTAIAIKLYIPRDPIIGDKFANRHGQKGVSSILWPQESMPFTSSGMTPDILFNPHGYPSRMTIGMMIESMAGKSGAHHGTVHDATPFTFSEDNMASDHYGKLLEAAGYNYHGTERMYSGVDGRELTADIFVGVLYYIRLRHMVGDKFQVRSTGPVDQLTHQPIKGRKRGGGVRFGEMERDSLLSHGCSFLLHDRLFNSSDKSSCFACTKCNSIISTFVVSRDGSEGKGGGIWSCRTCGSSKDVKKILVPYVLRYLVAELASVNIKVNFAVK